MTRRVLIRVCLALITGWLAAPPEASADFMTINFDTVPVLPLASTTFTTARQDLTIAGLGSVIGGTTVSTPTGLASFTPGGGSRNAYGTRSGTSFGYLQPLSIQFATGVAVTRVQGTLFNGFTDLNSYTVSIFNGTNLVGSSTFTDVEDTTLAAGFRNWDLSASTITRLVVTPDTTFSGGAWDYFIDNVGVTFTTVGTIPEPSSLLLVAAGLTGAGALAGLRRGWRAPA
jgi:hypothetical protein